MSESVATSPFNFERNMAALARVNGAAADFLRQALPPNNATAAVGRDGAATFEWRDGDGRLHWLGRTSMPTVSATALLEAYQPGQVNSLLVEIGQGEELKQLIARLAAHQAVFVVIEQPGHAVLSLRLHDFSAEIAAGRIVLCAGDDPWAQLSHYLIENAGYLVPDRVLCRPWYEPAYVADLSKRLEALSRDVDKERGQARLSAANRKPSNQREARIRAAIVSNTLDPACVRLADSLEDAADELGWQCRRHTLTTPRWVHPAAIQANLDEFQPDICLVVGAAPRGLAFALPACPTAVICSHGWGLAEEWLAQVPDDVMIVVRSQAQMGQLEAAGISKQRLHFWPPAARLVKSASPSSVPDKMFVMCDGLDASPEAVGLNLDTHQRLWRESRNIIAKQSASYTDDDAPAILRMAAKNLGIALTSAEVTNGLESRIRMVLGPATVREIVLGRLIAMGLPIEIYGMGRFSDDSVSACHRGPWPDPQRSAALAASCRAVIAIETGSNMPDGFLDCAAAGAILFQRAAVTKHDAVQYAGLDSIAHAVTLFRSAENLGRQLQGLGTGNAGVPSKREGETMRLIATFHAWPHRLLALRQHLLKTIHSHAQ